MISKTGLQVRREAEAEREVVKAAERFVSERENPAPDMTMRRIEYERLRDAVEALRHLRLTGHPK